MSPKSRQTTYRPDHVRETPRATRPVILARLWIVAVGVAHRKAKRMIEWVKKHWTPPAKIACAAVATAAYFALALSSARSFVDFTPRGKLVVQLMRPFEWHGPAASCLDASVRRYSALADDEENSNNKRSPFVIYENGVRLGPGHSNYSEIFNLGRGRFAHWASQGFVFSASDNSDPNTNGRYYWAVIE
jgi:hypothetical protein